MREHAEETTNGGALTANESAFRVLRQDIVEGKLAPGTRLVHRQLAKRLGTSNNPVIDALRRLEGAGLLITTPGVGTHVRQWQPHEIEVVYRVRAAHEGVACRLFVARATRADRALVVAYNEEYDAAVRSGEVEACIAADEQLHFHIARATQSQELVRLVDNSGFILLTIRNTMVPQALVPARSTGWEGVHARLVEALQSGDPERAEQEGRAHVLESYKSWRALLPDAQ